MGGRRRARLPDARGGVRGAARRAADRVRLVVARCFPTGALGYWARRLAGGGLLAVVTATSPARLAHPEGGVPLAGTNPIAIGVPSSDGRPLVSDVSMGRVTYGDVLAGLAEPDELVPFGGEHAHKAFALAVGLQLLVDSLVADGFGAVLVVARPEADPVPALRERAAGVRLPATASRSAPAAPGARSGRCARRRPHAPRGSRCPPRP